MVAKPSSLRFGLMLRVGTFNTLVVMLVITIASATVGNHEFLLISLFYKIFFANARC